ncbi:MAG: type II secretion system minor pseudopilin GspK [Pseudomonadota bacterium]
MNGRRKLPRRQRGVALITAMLIAALIAITAYSISFDASMEARRTSSLLYRDQAVQVALGAESWIASILADDLSNTDTDHLGEIWASELPGLPIDGGSVTGEIVDLQGRFNVNNLVDGNGEVDPLFLEQFERLLASLDIDPRFAGITADWIDSDRDASFPNGAEDGIYTGLTPPYRPPNQPLSNTTELAAIEGMDRATFRLLEPHIAALPGRTEINVNTATFAVLQSLDENLTASDVEGLVGERESSGFADYQNTFSTLVTDEMLAELDESTSYFQLKVVVQIATVRITLYSLLERGQQGNVVPILRSLGTA